MSKCLVPKCKNSRGRKENLAGITFHRIPKNEVRRAEWLNAIGIKQAATISKYAIVCSDHFSKDSFDRTAVSGLVRLRDNAIPVVEQEAMSVIDSSITHVVDVSFDEIVPSTSHMSKQAETLDKCTQTSEHHITATAMESTELEWFSFELPSAELSTAVFEKICRACFTSTEMTEISKITYENVNLVEIFKSCTSVQIEEKDNLPHNICESCLRLLIQLYAFKQQCQQSDVLLRIVLNQKSCIKQEDEIKVEELILSNAEGGAGKNSKELETENEGEVQDKKEFDSEEITTNYNEVKAEFVGETVDNNKAQEPCVTFIEQTANKMERRKAKGKKKKLKNQMEENCVRYTKKSYFCKQCNETFDSYNKFITHRKHIIHPKPRNHICPKCSKAFHHNDKLEEHIRTHTKEKPFICGVCLARFSSKSNLARHTKIHTGEKPHICEVCGKGFIQFTALQEHKITHKREILFVCSYCGLSFGRYSLYKTHLRRHLIENSDKAIDVFNCNICQRQLKTRASLSCHMLIHGEKTFLCSQCGKSFVSRRGLYSHSKTHTGAKPYTCTVCDKAFTLTQTLKCHMFTHTGQKPFVCEVCSRGFTQKHNLTDHIRTHTGEKPYSCTYCKKSFSQKKYLIVHTRKHTGETPYNCDICNRGFYDSISMKKHRQRHGQKT